MVLRLVPDLGPFIPRSFLEGLDLETKVTAKSIEVMVIENEAMTRQGLEALLEGTEGFSCLGAYRDFASFLDAAGGRSPDVVVMSLGLPGAQSGVEAIRKAVAAAPEAIVLVLTVHDDEGRVFEALAAGAKGYLTKPLPPAKLLEAIQDAYHGGSPMSSLVARKVVSFFRKGNLRVPETFEPIPLTRRERDVLRSLADGRSYKEIARESQMSINTVRYHIRNLYEKLGVHSQSEAVAKGLRQGLI